MGDYKLPLPVKLTCGFLSATAEDVLKAISELEKFYGPCDHILEPFPFTWTNYYQEEIGNEPFRAYVSFKNLVQREQLVEIKRQTNKLELEWFDGIRKVNLDPGYMTLGQFFLATTKDQRHRIYIRDGIFMETTLYFFQKKWHYFDWTYYDYRSEIYHSFFLKVRQSLQKDLANFRKQLAN